MPISPSSQHIIAIISAIPYGRVTSYSQIASWAGIPNGARRVARVLHSCSVKHGLPWHRVVKANGAIALPIDAGGSLQAGMLRSEGVEVSGNMLIDLKIYGWQPDIEAF